LVQGSESRHGGVAAGSLPNRVGTGAQGSRDRACAPWAARILSDADVRVACTDWPVWAARLRAIGGTIGAMLILVALLVPGLVSASTPVEQPKAPIAEAHHWASNWDGGACGEDEEDFEELIDCGAELDVRLDEPLAIALLRTTEVRMTAQQCEELLADIWSRQSCSASGRECGKLFAGGVVAPGLEIVSSSASGHLTFGGDALAGAQGRRLARPSDERMPKLRDLLPPVPPPRLGLR
jgi:hypothetical protein